MSRGFYDTSRFYPVLLFVCLYIEAPFWRFEGAILALLERHFGALGGVIFAGRSAILTQILRFVARGGYGDMDVLFVFFVLSYRGTVFVPFLDGFRPYRGTDFVLFRRE